MEKYLLIFLILGSCVGVSVSQDTCEQDVNTCTAEFTIAQQIQAQVGFNLTATCSIVNVFMTCVNTSLAPCDVVTKNTLRSAIDQLIGIYTAPPYNCVLDFAEEFDYGNCSQQVTRCGFYKYDAEENIDNRSTACVKFDQFIECMEENTTGCNAGERADIQLSIQNNTITFNQCPYACSQPDLICTTISSTTTELTTANMYLSPTPTLEDNVSDIDISDYIMPSIEATEVNYEATETFMFPESSDLIQDTASSSYNIQPTSVVQTDAMSTSTSTPISTSTSTSTEADMEDTTTGASGNTNEGTVSTKDTTARPTTTSNSQTSKGATSKPGTTVKVTAQPTTDFPTPNYDNAGRSATMSYTVVILLTSFLFAFTL